MIGSHLYELHASICKTLSHLSRLELLDCLRGGEHEVANILTDSRNRLKYLHT